MYSAAQSRRRRRSIVSIAQCLKIAMRGICSPAIVVQQSQSGSSPEARLRTGILLPLTRLTVKRCESNPRVHPESAGIEYQTDKRRHTIADRLPPKTAGSLWRLAVERK